MNIPTGFSPISRTSPVLDLLGPIYTRGYGKRLALGLTAQAKHCNARGKVHGGILCTLADVGMGHAAAFMSNPPAALVTISLSLEFAGSASIGDWLETEVLIQKKGSRLAFASCFIAAGGDQIAHASGVFLVTGVLAE